MSKPAARKTVAVDVDDVLASLARSFVEFSNEKWGTHLTIDDYGEHWHKLWAVDDEEELYKKADEFFKIYPKFKVIPSAHEALKHLSLKYKLVVVTSRRKKLDKITEEWLKQNYKGIFSEIHYSGIWDDLQRATSHKIKLTKAEVCRQIGADYLIDDQPKHCMAAAEAGITSLVFGDYSWNKDIELGPNMVRVKNWQEVLEYFDDK
jgi:uncharacterized HAD superfamily protein